MLNLDDWQVEILKSQGNLILCSGRQVGKSTIVAIKAAEEVVKKAKTSVMVVSFTEKQAQLLFFKILNYLEENYRYLIKTGRERPTRHIINLKNGSVIYCFAAGMTGDSLRGFTLNGVIIDEAPLMAEEIWMAIEPMMLTTGGWIWMLGTPHGAAGRFFEFYKNENKQFKVFHVNSEKVMFERKLSSSWTELQREKALLHLEDKKKSMSRKEYAQEYMGEFIKEFSQFFSDELIKKSCMLRRSSIPSSAGVYFLGVDVARMGEDECTFEIINRQDRKALIHVDSIVMQKQYLNEVTNKILELDKVYNFKKIYIDDGGIGVGVFDYLLENEQTKRKIIAINNRARPLDRDESQKKKLLKEDLYNNLAGLMERGEIKLLNDDEVIESFKSVQYEYVIKEKSLTKMRIFGNYTHIVEGLIRAAFCVKDKTLNIWVRY